jgi:hypothetical protein
MSDALPLALERALAMGRLTSCCALRTAPPAPLSSLSWLGPWRYRATHQGSGHGSSPGVEPPDPPRPGPLLRMPHVWPCFRLVHVHWQVRGVRLPDWCLVNGLSATPANVGCFRLVARILGTFLSARLAACKSVRLCALQECAAVHPSLLSGCHLYAVMQVLPIDARLPGAAAWLMSCAPDPGTPCAVPRDPKCFGSNCIRLQHCSKFSGL